MTILTEEVGEVVLQKNLEKKRSGILNVINKMINCRV
jgi:hypothetical protein